MRCPKTSLLSLSFTRTGAPKVDEAPSASPYVAKEEQLRTTGTRDTSREKRAKETTCPATTVVSRGSEVDVREKQSTLSGTNHPQEAHATILQDLIAETGPQRQERTLQRAGIKYHQRLGLTQDGLW